LWFPPPPPPPGRLGGLVDDLVDPLVAHAQGLGDLPQRSAGGVQPADRLVVVHLGPVGGVLGHRELLLRALGLAYQRLVQPHLSSFTRQEAAVHPLGGVIRPREWRASRD
jgi:hypothetical protein